MAWMKIGISALLWLFWANASASAQIPPHDMQAAVQKQSSSDANDASGSESVLEHDQAAMHSGTQQHSGAAMKSFADGYDSDAALKISQAAIGRRLEGYQFQDRQGRTVSLADYRGKPLLISMIYTSCFHICPTTTQNLAKAVATVTSAVGEDAFNVATIGFDALHDTPERMRGYARQHGVSSQKDWTFLSADQATIERLTADLGFLYSPSSKGFDHLIQATVVDGEGNVYRQIYGMEVDPALLTVAIKELVFGLIPVSFDLSSLVSRVRLFCTVYDPASDSYKFNYAMIFGMVVGVIVLSAMGVFLVWFIRKA